MLTTEELCILEKAKCILEKTKQSPLGRLSTACVKTSIAIRDFGTRIEKIKAEQEAIWKSAKFTS